MMFFPQGDSALFVQTGDCINNDTSALNRQIVARFNRVITDGIRESVISYTGFTIYFDPLVISSENITEAINTLSEKLPAGSEEPSGPGIIIPVAYGGEYGPDIQHVAEINGLTSGDVVRIHSEREYIVHMLGFTPGFPYLGGMSGSIAASRKRNPELRIEPGSVGIAGVQTGIYPLQSPGGWQIIGRTPLLLFDPSRDPEFLLNAGMRLRFRPVDNLEFWGLCESMKEGEYKHERF